jgi:hypothetical protein
VIIIASLRPTGQRLYSTTHNAVATIYERTMNVSMKKWAFDSSVLVIDAI